MAPAGSETELEEWTEEPHATRRAAILAAHPEIAGLFGADTTLAVVTAAIVVTQVIIAACLQHWALVLLQTYIVSGTMNHALTLSIHEISHNIPFGNRHILKNRLFGIFANLPLGIPASASFKKYHPDHHRYLGVVGLDVDLPTDLEVRLFRSPLGKLIWLSCQQFIYSLRPLVIHPKVVTRMELLNGIVQVAFNLLIFHFLGFKSLFYLICGTLMALGLHPASGHFISEHYVFEEGVDTNTYVGPLNAVMFNAGYHVEHHDFPFVSCARLPTIRAIAPEFYSGLPTQRSYVALLWRFVWDPSLGPGSRLKRSRPKNA